MKPFQNLLLVILIALGCTSVQATQTKVTFEDALVSGLPDGFGGISGWEQLGNVADTAWGTGIGQKYFHGRAGALTFDSKPVIFEGMFYNLWVGSGQVKSYDLFYKGSLVYTGYVDGDSQPSELYWLKSGYSGAVDSISFYSYSDGYALDNLTYSLAPVPEPSSVAMMLAGVMLIGQRIRSSRRRFSIGCN